MIKTYVKAQHLLQAMKDESGQDLVEYALIVALVSVALIAGLGTLATAIKAAFSSASASL